MSKYSSIPIPNLTLKQKMEILIDGHTFYKYIKSPGDLGFLPVYVVRCPKPNHRLFLDYPHGYNGYFYCPHCEQLYEEKQAWKKQKCLIHA